MVALLLATLATGPFTLAPDGAEAPPIPSGLDLLYGDRVPIQPSGEPLLAVGLMTGQTRIVVRAAGPMQADFYEESVLKRSTIKVNEPVEVTVLRAQPAKRRYYVDVEGFPQGRTDLLEWAVAGWRARGYPEVEAIEQGTVLGISGRVLDNREYRVVLPCDKREQAGRKVTEVYEQFGTRAFVSARLTERPWAELKVRGATGPLGRATSYVRFSVASGTITVEAVEFGKGYAWHGFENRAFRGEIYVVVDPDGRLAAVNVLGAEALLQSVVPSEMFASSPAEALKAQAVAARNQLFARLGKRHHDDPFHLCSEQHCQVYGGVGKEDPRSNAAVIATAGEVANLDGFFVDTVYSSTCGGHTEDNEAVWGNAADPALRGRPDFDVGAAPPDRRFVDGIPPESLDGWLRTKPESFCARASKTRPDKLRWSVRLTARELAALLAPQYGFIGTLLRIDVEERGRGGRVQSLALVGTQGTATVIHELPIRQLFGNLNSGAFVVDHERDAKGGLVAVTFVGGGWGHGVGMCQIGAVGRAEAGQTYQQILAHYYNGATVEHFYRVPPPPVSVAAP